MITLALDLATSTGVAIRYDEDTVWSGIWYLGRGKVEKRSPLPMLRVWRRLEKLSETHVISRVIFEETFGRGAAKHRLDSLQFAVMLWCSLRKVNFIRVSPPAWKRAMLGNAKTPKDVYFLKAVEKFTEQRVRNDDIAAALWLLEYSDEWDRD